MVVSGIVPRLDRPGGNVTGFANLEASMGGKWPELLSEIAPGLKRAAIMFNPDTAPVSTYMPSLEAAARSLKVEPITLTVHSDVEIETPIIALGREPGSGFVVMSDVFTNLHRASIILAAGRNQVPAVYNLSQFARDGGLLSYGPDRIVAIPSITRCDSQAARDRNPSVHRAGGAYRRAGCKGTVARQQRHWWAISRVRSHSAAIPL